MPPGLKKQPSASSVQRRKHWPIKIPVTLPGVEEPLVVETNTSLKVKNLKELIKEKAPSVLKEVPIDRIQLQIEAGAILKKNSSFLEDSGIKDRSSLTVTILDKAQSAPREKRIPAKDEPKIPIIYTLKNPLDLNESSNPEAEEVSEINTASAKAIKGGQQRSIEILGSFKIKQLRQAIKDDLGLKDKVSLKLILPITKEVKKTVE